LGVLRFIKNLGSRARCVLGNHDLHLLSLAEGFGKPRQDDTLTDILTAPDRDELLAWLRQQNLAYYEPPFLMVHAGVLKDWSTEQVLALAHEVETRLQGKGYRDLLSHMYGNQPTHWRADLAKNDRHRLVINALTRLRVCSLDGAIDLSFKGEVSKIPEGRLPWFELPKRGTRRETLVFGHWSALGLFLRDNLIGIDTGCVWGRALTAVRLEDRAVFSEPA
jgi:bis(5'-nucleosyl)-tetraphosphatase (symmetrical)